MKKRCAGRGLVLTVSLLVWSVCAYGADIPDTKRVMKSPGFWISRQPDSDIVTADSRGIGRLNETITNDLMLTRDLTNAGALRSGEKLKAELSAVLMHLQHKKCYDKNGSGVPAGFFKRAKENMALEEIAPEIPVRYGFIYAYADQRILPTDEIITLKPGDIEFDALQNSSLDISSPVVVVHQSRDARWLYVHAATSSGWVRKECVVFCGEDEFKGIVNTQSTCVVINPKADIFWDPQMRSYYDFARMGARFVVRDSDAETVQVAIPFAGDGGKFIQRTAYLRREDVQLGFLKYTPRTIIQQAFKLLNAPYGWGGSSGEQDCSAFLQEIFATVGIILPRNSPDQGKVGAPLGHFDEKAPDAAKIEALSKATGGITIIQLQGHVLLYLGMYDGRPYAIHETHAFGRKSHAGSREVVVNRVIVSDLFLGKGSKKGSLLERMVEIRGVR